MTKYFDAGNRAIPIRGQQLIKRFQRPLNYSLVINTGPAVCLAPNRQNTPVSSFVVQSDNGNGGLINIGDSMVSLTNGIELVGGQAFVFAPSNVMQFGGLAPGPMAWHERTKKGGEFSLYLDISDFFCVVDTDDSRVRIFYSLDTQ